jgi:serine/threonine-protein kinase RsbW
VKNLRILPGDPPPLNAVVLARTWPSRLDLKTEIMDTIVASLRPHGVLSEADETWLTLCLDEAVVNAMLHGNEGDPGLPVRVEVAADAQGWTIRIHDQGDGFSADAIPDVADPASLLLEHGRGIRIMREWLTDLVYYRSGATISMHRRSSQSAAVHVRSDQES